MINSKVPFLRSNALSVDELGVLSQDEKSALQKTLVSCPKQLHRCLVEFLAMPHYCLTAYAEDMKFIQLALPNLKYHVLHRIMDTVYISMVTRKNFFLTRKMSMLILRSNQAGLIGFWHQQSLRSHQVCELNDPD